MSCWRLLFIYIFKLGALINPRWFPFCGQQDKHFFFLHVGCLLHALLKFCWSPQWFLACSFLPQIVMPQCCGFVALMPMQCCLSACCGKETEGCILEGSLSSDAVKAQPYVSSMFWSVYNITHVPLWSHDSGHNFSYMVCFSFWIIPFSFYSLRFDQVPPDMKSMHTGESVLPQISFVPVSSSGRSSWQAPGLMLRKVVISENSFSHCWMLSRSYLLSRSLAALMGCQGLRFCSVCKQVWAFMVFTLSC